MKETYSSVKILITGAFSRTFSSVCIEILSDSPEAWD